MANDKSLQDRVMEFESELRKDAEFQSAYENLVAVYQKKFEEALPEIEEEEDFDEVNEDRYNAMRENDPDDFDIYDFLWLNA